MSEPSTELSPPAVSVVVATHDRADRLERLLDSLEGLACEFAFEVVVVDDGSRDGTADLLERRRRSEHLGLRVVTRAQAAGPATARDMGWRTAQAELIAFTDDDCRVHPGWLAAGRRAAAQEPGGIVQGRTEPDPEQRDRRGPFSRTIEVLAPDAAFQTCNVFYPRALLEQLDGFDIESFGRSPGGEDADLAWRAIEAGAPTTFAPEAIVYHEVADLGPAGKLRVAARWTTPMRAYVRHPRLRRAHFANHFFWKHTHMYLARALLALLLRGRLRLLAPWLVLPYARAIWARGKLEGGGPALAPFFVLHDLIEIYAVARAAVRYRSPML